MANRRAKVRIHAVKKGISYLLIFFYTMFLSLGRCKNTNILEIKEFGIEKFPTFAARIKSLICIRK